MDKEKKVKPKKEKRVKKTSIGGQALLEGVMMQGATATALAVRNPDGDIMIEAKRTTARKRWYRKVPVIRGLVAFFASLVTGVKALVKSASVSAPEEETPGKFWMGFAVFLGLAFGIGLFFVVPWALNYFVFDRFLTGHPLLSSLIEGGIRMVIFILYLFLVSLMKDIRRTFMYHGAEHRTINCFEKDLSMTVENVQTCSTRHNRCGTTFLFFVMLVSILIFSLMSWLLSLTTLEAAVGGGFVYKLVLLLIRLACLPLVAGLSYELLRGLAALPDNWFTAIFRAPGLALQRLTTYKPDDEMAEVALRAFTEVYEMDNDPSLPELEFGQFRYKTLREDVEKALGETNADAAEADWIFCDVTGLKRSELAGIKLVTQTQYKKIREILSRRKAGEPLWYILGYCDFYGFRMVINHNALIPRAETEILAEAAIREIKVRPGKEPAVLDLCTGSGCIALAVLKNTDARVTASDFSEAALTVAANNLEGTGADVVFSNLFDNLKGRSFDIIVSNPPYIKSADIENLAVEVQGYEPVTALDGGADGLDFYRRIVAAAPAALNRGGCILFETGFDQAADVKKLLEKDFKDIEIIKDMEGIERVVKGYKK